MDITVIGWIGSVCFSICALPQAIACHKQGHGIGLNAWMLVLWFFGEILSLVYLVNTIILWPILVNYIFNLLCLVVILRYKLIPKGPAYGEKAQVNPKLFP